MLIFHDMSANKSEKTQLLKSLEEINSDQTLCKDIHINKLESTLAKQEIKKSNDKIIVATEEIPTNMPNIGGSRVSIPESMSDFKDWLEGIKMVARLPGGMPAEFRRKLWLALAERYLKRRGVDWEIEKVKWFSEKWRADDEELGIQIVKDLHRTGHSLLAGPSGALNQAKLKRILLGFTRWNPQIGYCQGFNMLGAIILQVMEKNEVDSIKVMIFLIEGLLPNGYFCGSLMGLQIDMAVFRELLGKKLPKLARHLQKLQYSTNEPSVEPPLINVFTMQWFLTLFCNCLPMDSVLRIWDLIMIEGSDILLRTALAIWKILEERILREVRTADDFYCKMETLSAELLDENQFDSNVLIQLISDLGPISDLQKLRHKHLSASYQDQKQLKMIYSKVQGESEKMAVANAWQSKSNQLKQNSQQREQSDREKIALDITVLKKQYDKLRERQKQAHIILTSAVSKQNQQKQQQTFKNVNKLLVGKPAIVSSKGRRGPPKGAIPPARKVAKNNTILPKNSINDCMENEIPIVNDVDDRKRNNNLTWKEIHSDSARKRSDSSSYSENSESESSTSTSLCDDENQKVFESTPIKKKRKKKFDETEIIVNSPSNISPKNFNLEQTLVAGGSLNEIKSCPDMLLNEISEEKNDNNPDMELSLPDTELEISSTSQLSPIPDISTYFSTAISPIKTPENYYKSPAFASFTIGTPITIVESNNKDFFVNEQGVTNEFFERAYAPSTFPLNEMNDMNESFNKVKHTNQKTFSMEEDTQLNVEETKLNRSFSDGKIITLDTEQDRFDKIIAENSKILDKLSYRNSDSVEYSSHSIKKEFLEHIEDSKFSSDNSSVCEEIAAIDAEEFTNELASLPSIRNIDNVELKSDKDAAFFGTNDSTHDISEASDVMKMQNEKSIELGNTNSDDASQATLENCNKNTFSECESFAKLSLSMSEASGAVKISNEVQESEETKSPRFNEISALVDKLKEVMESDLSKASEKNEFEKVKDTDELKIMTNSFQNLGESRERRPEDIISELIATKSLNITITINDESLKNNTNVIVGNASNDLEIMQKINKNIGSVEDFKVQSSKNCQNELISEEKDSNKILEKLNYQLQRYEEEKCQNLKNTSRSPSVDRVKDYKRELETLIKERDFEKFASTSSNFRADEHSTNIYDHEPRSEFRRKDFVTLESDFRIRRPFKSSPSRGLSSSPSNISSTLSSIQNTIKSLDSACQRSEIYNIKKLDRAMESIEKICDSDKEWQNFKRKTFDPSLCFNTDDTVKLYTHKNTFGDEEIYQKKISATSNVEDLKNKTSELDSNYMAKLRCLSTEEYIAGRRSPLNISGNKEKLNFNRYSRMDRSPTSPLLSQFASSSSKFLRSPREVRESKSAENSPSRNARDLTSLSRTHYNPSSSASDLKTQSRNNNSMSSLLDENNYNEYEWRKTSRTMYDI